MKRLIFIALGFILAGNIFGQNEKVSELVSQGTRLHDQGKYEEAIAKYRAALDIDKHSTLANYELSFTYMTIQKYDEAIYYSRKVVDQNEDLLEHAYLVLGSSLDLMKKPREAIKAYKEGLAKFPNSNLLNYNLALTAYNIGDLAEAETASVSAILSKPSHGSSHIVLASVMQDKEERVKALLPMYYFLLIEPDSKRSLRIYKIIRTLLVQGIEQKSDKQIDINVSYSAGHDSLFRPAETFLSLIGASKFAETNKDKSDYELFAETNKGLFSVLEGIKKENKGLWWDLYVTKFSNLIQSNNWEAFSYYISQSTNAEEVKNWISRNDDKMKKLHDWMNSMIFMKNQ
jgi:tetratricopeptide (TPR) repeat protein